MMWRRSLRRPGLAGLPCVQPALARLAALPGAGGEAQNLDLDAAAFQRARQNVGAGGRDRDRAPAHRAGIVEQKRDHRVAEIGVLLALERERMQRIDDDARQPRRIEQAFFQIELPGAALLRQQTAAAGGWRGARPRLAGARAACRDSRAAGRAPRDRRDLPRRSTSSNLARERLVVRTARLVAIVARPPRLGGVSESPISVSSAMSAAGASIGSAALSGMSSVEASASSRLMRSLSADSEVSPSLPDSSLRLLLVALVAFLFVGVGCCGPRPCRGNRADRAHVAEAGADR